MRSSRLLRFTAASFFAAAVFLLVGTRSAHAAHPATAREPASRTLTADELVARNIEARGGKAKLAAIHSLRLTGKILIGRGDRSFEGDFGQLQKRPDQIRTEFSLQGLTRVESFDGTDAWALEPFQGRRDPQRTSADEARTLAEDADIDGPLVDAAAKGNRIEYLGSEDVDGTPAYKLRVALKDGNTKIVFLDTDYYLVVREVTQTRVRGVEQITESDYGGYAQVGGVWMPLTIESGEQGAPKSSRLTIQHAEPNVEVDDALFRFPAPGVATGRAIVAAAKAAPVAAAVRAPPGPKVRAASIDAGVLSGLGARNIGSAMMSGRIAAIAAYNDSGKTTIYVGAASGGVWRSLDSGTTFKPVFDRQPVQSIGAIAIDPIDPKIVWVGSGEAWTRNSVSIGDGVYKSSDGGETWANMGLPNSERISRIVVNPKDSNTVYVCAPGKLFSDSPDRGLYKTIDGGKSWDLILAGPNLSTGCADLSMDARDPEVLFASLWDFRRKGWTFRSGGDGEDAPSGSGFFRSSDGGKSWKSLDQATAKGLPAKPWGRIAVSIAPSDSNIVYAMIESKDSALYRSADGGATWEARDRSQSMVWRPFYFARLIVDPVNPDRLFKPNLHLIVSEDGGRSFSNSSGKGHGDWHDVWIDPQSPKHVLGGDDGGLWLSYDGGSRWWKAANLPISQFYHVAVDNRDPYQVYGGLQDNSSWVGDSAYPDGITNSRWENLYGGDGFWVQPDPTDSEAVYAESQGGHIGRVDRRTHSARFIMPTPNYQEKLRFNWNAPIQKSPTDKDTLYIGAQFLFRSRDRGDSWQRISPDLTTNDPAKQMQEESGGITVDNSSAEMHTTVYSISESPKDHNQIWVGTDDGNLQLTRDAGGTWTNVVGNVKGLPKASWVSWVEASRFDAGTAYATFDRHTFGDMSPWVFRTTDFGKSWTRIVSPASDVRGYAHVIKEDAALPQLLFLGTEFGLWISPDSGKTWAKFTGAGFPCVAVRDLQIQQRDNDLVLATHGRGLWIIDDLTPLRALASEAAGAPGGVLSRVAAFLPSRPVQQRIQGNGGWPEGDATFVGEDPVNGAVITYYQRTRHLFGPIRLEIFDAAGKLVDTIPATRRRGINRVAWSMQVKPPRVPRAASIAFGASQGPRVLPGPYTVRLTKGSEVFETRLEIGLDRRAPYTLADRAQQFDAVMRLHALFGEMSTVVDRVELSRRAADQRALAIAVKAPALAQQLRAVSENLDTVRKKIVATKEGGAVTGEERIREHADELYKALVGWEGKPAQYQLARIDSLTRELDTVKSELEQVVNTQVRPLDDALRGQGLQPIPTNLEAE